MKLVRVLVVHRQRIVAETLARRLECEPTLSVIGIESGEGPLLERIDVLGPDVAILEVGGAQELVATELCRQLVGGSPPVRVVAIVEEDDPALISRVIRAGADGVTTTDDAVDDLIMAIEAVGHGHAWVLSRLLSGVLDAFRASQPPPNEFDRRIALLTTREREVLQRMVSGWDHATIARDLLVSINTVRTHSQRILNKLEVHSGLEAVSVFRNSSSSRGVVTAAASDE